MSTHVDDLEMLGKPKENQAVVDLMLKHKLKIKLEGLVKVGEGKSAFLKRMRSAWTGSSLRNPERSWVWKGPDSGNACVQI